MGRKLGKGGFAVCFEGRSKTTSEVFALKVVKAKVDQKKMMEKFRTELQIHAKMHHPNIVEFLRAFTIEDHTYVVLQLCPNGSLTEMVKVRACLSLPEVRRYMIQICGGVKYMHKRSVIHRDLKMGNIFLDARMNIKIGDFGLAAVMADEHDRRTTLCGTPNYIAPEILSKSSTRGHDNKVDTWAIGVICYAMLMGTPPFQSKTQQEIYSKLRTLEYEWKIDSNNYVPQQAKDFVASCLNLNSAERPEMDELVEHEFFTMGAIADVLDTLCLKSKPTWLENADPSGDKVVPGYGISHSRLCRECGVGIGSDGRSRAGVGVGVNISTLLEIEAENREGCAPVVPLPPGTLYKQFSNAQAEFQARQKHPLLPARIRSRKPITEKPGQPATSSAASKVETQLLPISASRAPSALAVAASRPVQSFAAQQRQQAIPSGAIRRIPVSQEEIPMPADPQMTEPPIQALLRERPLRAATIRATRSATLREPVSTTARTLPRSTTAPDGVGEVARQRTDQERPDARRVKSGTAVLPLRSVTQSSRSVPRPAVTQNILVRPGSSSSASSGSLSDAPTRILQPTAGNERRVGLVAAEIEPKLAQPAPKPRAASQLELIPQSLIPKHQPRIIARTDRATPVTSSSSQAVLDSLQDLHNALDPRSVQDKRPRSGYGTRKLRPRSSYPRVDKWVDYSTRHGIAYILTDGTVGMVLKTSEDNKMPSSCVVVRNASAHTIKRAKGLEYQFVPQGPEADDVEFYELSDYEVGMTRLDIPASRFLLDLTNHPNQVAAANAVQATLSGTEAERMKEVALLDKFGKYMNKQGGHGVTCDKRSNYFIHFYQRIGNVTVWRYADGGLQFNFPDHTKITIHRQTGDSKWQVNSVYLMPNDAVGLANHGIVSSEAMERRDELSLPLEDIMAEGLRRSEMEIVRTNEVKEKLCWVRAVIGCWIKEGGLGKMGEERLGWSGLQERRNDKQIKLQWVTVGRFGGDGEGPK